jgi:hypothetical protein
LILTTIFFVILFFNNGSLSISPSSPLNNTIDIKFTDKNYSLKFPDILDKNISKEIAGFEEKEGWKGSYTLDDSLYFEGETSMVMDSRDHIASVATLDKSLNLDGYDVIKMVTYIATDEEVEGVESLTVNFSNKDEIVSYSYPVTALKKGWDVVKMSKEAFALTEGKGSLNWNNIEKVSLVLVSRSKAKTEVIMDRLWAEKNDVLGDYVRTLNNKSISYKSFNSGQYLSLWNIANNLVTIKKVTSVQDFSYFAKLIPQKRSPFGIVGRVDSETRYGYYLSLDGINTGTWKLYRYDKPVDKTSWVVLTQGSINNFVIEKDKPVWLKMEFKGAKIIGYISMDGRNYTKLAKVVDREYKSGGIGIFSLGASVLIDEVNFSQ